MESKIVKRKDLAQRVGLDEQVKLEAPSGFEMPRQGKVIRPESHQSLNEAKQFFEKAKAEADAIRKEARELLSQVGAKVEKARKEGFSEGKEQGYAEVTELLTKAIHAKEKMFEDMEKNMIQLVYDVAEKIIGRELVDKNDGVVQVIREALKAAMGQQIVLYVNPSELDIVRAHQPDLMQVLEASKVLQIRSDEKVTPKGCRIETEVGTIDAQLDTQLAAIRRALELDS